MRARLLVAAFGLSLAASAVSVSLDGTWTLSYRNQQAPDAAWTSIPAPVPGDTYAALHAAGVIPDPQLGTNAWAIRAPLPRRAGEEGRARSAAL